MRRAPEALLAGILLAATFPAVAQLGTLFHSPEERARLDKLRRGEPAREVEEGPARTPRLSGYVQRSDGRGTVWIDGVPHAVTTPHANKALQPGDVQPRTGQPPIEIETRKPAR